MPSRFGTYARLIVPDSHGSRIDVAARDAMLADLPAFDIRGIVMVGDHLDYDGPFSVHQPDTDDDYVVDEDTDACNELLDKIQERCPRADEEGQDYLEGNHEQHFERFVVRTLGNRVGDRFRRENGPEGQLRLRQRGFRYFRRFRRYDGLAIPNTIVRGKMHFTHGITAAKHAAAIHVARFNANVTFGHTHRAQEYRTRTVRDEAMVGINYGCLCELQPHYLHTNLSEWTHGYGIQFVDRRTGHFQNLSVAIVGGRSMLTTMRIRG